jgi:hypothetical protein
MTEKITDTRKLRAFLVDQMTEVAEGNTEVAVAKGICNLAQQVYNTINIELKTAVVQEKIGGKTLKPVKFDG